MTTRRFLLGALAAGGALVVGWGLLPPRSRIGDRRVLPLVEGEVGLNGWIKVARDGSVRLAMPRAEMGQGVHTALAMLAAEELDVGLDQVTLIEAGPERLYGNLTSLATTMLAHPGEAGLGESSRAGRVGLWLLNKTARELGLQITGGSSSIADAWDVLPLAAATARAQLLGAASLAWKLPVTELAVERGTVRHPSGPSAHYGELAERAAATPPGDVKRKPRDAWKLVGTAAPRTDLRDKVTGRAVFGIDVRPEGLVFAAVRHSPMLGGDVARLDVDALLRRPGVERVVRLGSYAGSTPGFAVVARTTWHAMDAARRAAVQWLEPPAGHLDSATIESALEARARAAAADDAGFAFANRGDAIGALEQAARRVEALYRAPYLAHAAMEPMNCTAQVKDGRVTVWAPTQVPTAARALAARVAGVDVDRVTLHVPYLGGGFGRRLEVDVVGQTVRVALETGGRPVQLVWSREEDFTHDFYRPAGAALLRAGFAGDGTLSALHVVSAGDAITPRNAERTLPALAGPIDPPDKTAIEGLHQFPYAVPHLRVAHAATHSGVPVGYWRSVGHSHHAFFAESFVDELAHARGRDPVAFRLELLAGKPAHAAVLKLAAEKAGWGGPLAAGRARGVALHESYGSVVAMVVEAALDGGRPRALRVVCAADCGTVVNPGIVAQQVEGGVMYALAAALHGRITIERSEVQQKNYPDQPLLALRDAPRVELHLVPSTRAPGGVGEIAVPPLAPALANAIFALTGRRLRELPLRLA